MESSTFEDMNGFHNVRGRHSYGSVEVVGYGHVNIGNFCSIAEGVEGIMVGHPVKSVTTFPFNSRKMRKIWDCYYGIQNPIFYGDINIGNDVWIGENATIKGGVTIGDGAVVAMGSVVVNNVDPYMIVGGNPAKLIRMRFGYHTVQALLKIKWWDWPDDKIKENLDLLLDHDIMKFVNKHRLIVQPA